jgi:hypothetical protein
MRDDSKPGVTRNSESGLFGTVSSSSDDDDDQQSLDDASSLSKSEIWNLSFCLLAWACTVSNLTLGKRFNSCWREKRVGGDLLLAGCILLLFTHTASHLTTTTHSLIRTHSGWNKQCHYIVYWWRYQHCISSAGCLFHGVFVDQLRLYGTSLSKGGSETRSLDRNFGRIGRDRTGSGEFGHRVTHIEHCQYVLFRSREWDWLFPTICSR